MEAQVCICYAEETKKGMQDRVPMMLGLDQIAFRQQVWRRVGRVGRGGGILIVFVLGLV